VSDRTFRLVANAQRLAGPLLQVPAHVQFFTHRSLETLADLAGFARVEQLDMISMRARPPVTSLRKWMARRLIGTIDRIERNRNLYTWMGGSRSPASGKGSPGPAAPLDARISADPPAVLP
jgi:hypothetical protein